MSTIGRTKATNRKLHSKINQMMGARLRNLRKRCKINQTELAPVLGIDQSALSRVESGAQVLTVSQWIALCMFLEVKCDSLTRRVRRALESKARAS